MIERWRAWRRGFDIGSYRAFHLDENDSRNYVPDLPMSFYGTKINGFFNPILGNKLVLSDMLIGFGIPCAPLIGAIVKGRAFTFPQRDAGSGGDGVDGSSPDQRSVAETIHDWVSTGQKLVLRPHWSGGGEGVFFVDRSQEQWQLNGFPCSEQDLLLIISSLDRYLVTAYVQQAEYAASIYGRVANTIRVLTLRDADGPYVAAVVHRFGSSRSYPVDNFHQGRGGLSVYIEPDTGVMGKGLTVNAQGNLELFSHHPETEAPLEGVLIPHYERMVGGLLKACNHLPEALIVGWDVLITDDGYCVIEGNAPPGLVVWQVHQPLLANRRNAKFFHAHGLRVAKHLLA
ncbi:MAG: sugar-transfer associated ATP-grasp domain-containing protein [Planctomycetota bacterium]